MSKNQTIKLISKTFDKLNYALQHTRHFDRLVNMEKQAAKEYGRNRGERGISKGVEAKLFTCQHILDGLVNEKTEIETSSMLHLRHEYIYGLGVAQEYRAELLNAISLKDARHFLDTVDYAELMKV